MNEGSIVIAQPELSNDGTIVMTDGRIDNRLWADTTAAPIDPTVRNISDARFVFQGKKSSGGVALPSIWKFSVQPLGLEYNLDTCPDGPYVSPPFGAYCERYNVDPETGLECYDITVNYDCTPIYPDNGLITINDSGIGYFMDKVDQAPDGAPIMIYSGDYSPVNFEDIESVYWHEGDQLRLPFYTESDNYYYMDYNMGSQRFQGGEQSSWNNIYFRPFDGQIPFGDHHFTLNLKNGMSDTWTLHVASNTLMPTIAKYYTYDVTKTNKSGKVINTGQTVTIQNLTARPITDDNGEECLLIQFAEPDRAMELVPVSGGGVKLRIWVADPEMLRTNRLEVTLCVILYTSMHHCRLVPL